MVPSEPAEMEGWPRAQRREVDMPPAGVEEPPEPEPELMFCWPDMPEGWSLPLLLSGSAGGLL